MIKAKTEFEIELDFDNRIYDGKWCCYLRPAPSGLSIDTHYTHGRVMETIDKQKWYPKYCYYCYCCIIPNPDAWENHVVRHHAGKICYPGRIPAVTAKILEIIEEREHGDVNGKSRKKRT